MLPEAVLSSNLMILALMPRETKAGLNPSQVLVTEQEGIQEYDRNI